MQMLICKKPIHCWLADEKAETPGLSKSDPNTNDIAENSTQLQKTKFMLALVVAFEVISAMLYRRVP